MTKDVDEGHLQLVGVLDELARSDPAYAAATNTAAQVIGLDTLGKEAERQAFMELVRALEEAGYAKVEGTNQAASIGAVYVTEKGCCRLRKSYGQLDSSAKRTSSLRRPASGLYLGEVSLYEGEEDGQSDGYNYRGHERVPLSTASSLTKSQGPTTTTFS